MSGRTVVVGLPGSGKSTVGRAVAAAIRAEMLEERPEEFEFLEDAFQEPTRYAALGQVEFLVKKANVEIAKRGMPLVQEVDSRYCHAVWSHGLREAERISSRELRTLCELARVLRSTCPAPERIVVLEVGWDEMLDRVSARAVKEHGRLLELERDYVALLEILFSKHEAWVEHAVHDVIPCISVDASNKVETIVAEVVSFIGTRRKSPGCRSVNK
jgi:deoxyadenosine/deoxycytidine kinase